MVALTADLGLFAAESIVQALPAKARNFHRFWNLGRSDKPSALTMF